MRAQKSNIIKLPLQNAMRKADKRVATISHHVPRYYFGQINHCSHCGYKNWHIGRNSAECGYCGSAAILVKP